VSDSKKPFVVFSSDEYLILYKPPFMHSAPLKQGESGTLSSWCAERFPEFFSARGRKALEGGLLHRLDYETRGLVFVALTQRVMNAMLRQQSEDSFIKEYEAIAGGSVPPLLPGFPPCPASYLACAESMARGFYVDSGFRYYGKGRKSVRPLLPGAARTQKSNDRVYRTEIMSMEQGLKERNFRRVNARLTRGFRHQIRCHLAWLGLPIQGDILYGGHGELSSFSLRAVQLSFIDPLSGLPRCVRYRDY
jgi:23S rRNA pseudouridine1911/1915/1917 synthase